MHAKSDAVNNKEAYLLNFAAAVSSATSTLILRLFNIIFIEYYARGHTFIRMYTGWEIKTGPL